MKYVRHLVILIVFSGCLFSFKGDKYLSVCINATGAISYSPCLSPQTIKWGHYPLVIREDEFQSSSIREPRPALLNAVGTLNSYKNLFVIDNYEVNPDIVVLYNYPGKFYDKDAVAITMHSRRTGRMSAVIMVGTKIDQYAHLHKFLIHELLHALGYAHTDLPGSILNVRVDADSVIPRVIEDELRKL